MCFCAEHLLYWSCHSCYIFCPCRSPRTAKTIPVKSRWNLSKVRNLPTNCFSIHYGIMTTEVKVLHHYNGLTMLKKLFHNKWMMLSPPGYGGVLSETENKWHLTYFIEIQSFSFYLHMFVFISLWNWGNLSASPCTS